MPTTSSRVPKACPTSASTARVAMLRAVCTVAEVRSVRAAPTAARSSCPVRSPTAIRKSSWRRTTRAASHGVVGRVLASVRCRHRGKEGPAAAGGQSPGVAEDGNGLGRTDEQVCGVTTSGQNVGKALGRAALVAEHPEVPGGRAQGVTDLSEGQQAGVRVGLVGEPAEHDRQQGPLDRGPPGESAGEGLKMAHRPSRVTKAQRCQPFSRGFGVRWASVLLSLAAAVSSGR